jgi:hypothetical protein
MLIVQCAIQHYEKISHRSNVESSVESVRSVVNHFLCSHTHRNKSHIPYIFLVAVTWSNYTYSIERFLTNDLIQKENNNIFFA